MGKAKKQTIGYEYYMGIHMGLGRGPVDELCEIRVGDREAWKGSITGNTRININKGDLFGGHKGEGGIDGPLDVFMGGPTQVVTSALKNMLGGNQPEFRGIVSVFFDGMVSAMTPYPKSWTFRLRRTLKGWDGAPWYPEKAVVEMQGYGSESEMQTIKAMNGVHIIYEALTNRAWGLGRDRSLFLEDTWRKAADQAYDEGFGLCLRWARQDTLMSFVQTVIDHLGAAVYVDKFTGKYKIKLIREDYEADALPIFDVDSGLLSIDEATNSSPYNLTNEVVINWNNPLTNKSSQARDHNLALIQTQGSISSDTRDYPGIPTAKLALIVAKRDLKSASTSVRRFSLTCDRRAWRVQPGDVFKIRDPQSRGIETVIVRVGSTEEAGQDDGKIKIVCVQDMFGVDLNTFGQVQPPGHIEPDYKPKLARRVVYEATYAELARWMPDGEFAAMKAMEGFLRAHAEKPTGLSMAFDLFVRPEGAATFVENGGGDFTPLGEMTVSIGYLDTQVTLTNLSLDWAWSDLIIGSQILIGKEMMRLEAYDVATSTLTVGRGSVDTIPQRHFGGDVVWMVADNGGSDWVKYLSSEHVDVKVAPWTLKEGHFPVEDIPVDSVDFAHRFIRPYPPGRMQWETLAGGNKRWYETQDLRADVGPDEVPDYLRLTWTHRDRVIQSDKLIEHNEGDVGPEPGQSYRMRVFNATGELVRTETGIAGTEFVYTYGNAAQDLQVEAQATESTTGTLFFDSMRSGYNSWMYYTLNLVVHKKPPQNADVALFTMQSVSDDSDISGDGNDNPDQAQVAEQSMQTSQGDDSMSGGDDLVDSGQVAQLAASNSQTTKLLTVIDFFLYEAPYLTLARDGRDLDHSQALAFVARPSDRLTDGFDLYERLLETGSWNASGAQPWTPWGQMKGFIAELTNEFEVDNTSDTDGVPIGSASPGDLLLVDTELMKVLEVNGKRIKVGRGSADTIPSVHYAKSLVWLFDRAHAAGNTLFGDNDIAQVSVVPHSYGQALTTADVPSKQLQMQYRPKRPYPPGLMLANGKHWFETVDARGDDFDPYAPKGRDIPFTWAHRNRVAQGDTAVDHFTSGITPEPGVKYRIWLGYSRRSGSQVVKVTLDTFYTEDAGWMMTKAMAESLGERAGRVLGAEAYVQIDMAINAVRDDLYNWQGYGFRVILPSIPLTPGKEPGGGTVTPPPVYPDPGDPTPNPNDPDPTDPGDGGTVDPTPDPENPTPNPDPEVPDTDPPAPEPEPEPDPDNVYGWSIMWDHGWAAGLPDQTVNED